MPFLKPAFKASNVLGFFAPVIFCILIIVNGSNFIDGVNTNVIGYYIIVSSIIIYLGFTNQLFENVYNFYIWVFICFTIYNLLIVSLGFSFNSAV